MSNVLIPPQPLQITVEQAIQLAGQQIDAGQLKNAENILRQILEKQPGNAFAIHLLGVIAHRAGRTELAVELIDSAIKILPSFAAFHTNRGEMCRILKRLDEAIYHGEQAVRLDPKLAIAHSNLGIAYYDKKDYEHAEACQKKALELSPASAKSLNNLGNIQRERGDMEGAVAYFRQALGLVPDYIEAGNNLGAALTEMDKSEEAVAVFRQALVLNPDNASALIGLARIYKEKEQLDEACAMVDRALMVVPDKAEVYDLSGDIYTKMGLYEQAEAAYHKAIALDEKLIGAHLGMGRLHMELGRLNEAEASYQRAMDIAPEAIAPYEQMAQVKKIGLGDPILERLESEIKQLDTMPKTKAMPLHFALGKAYDDLNEYDKAFPHFAAGCRIKRDQIQYDADHQDQVGQNIRDFFSKERIDRMRGGGDPSNVPIFVLGMPRSGTTLTETIIASHPDVFGGGELRYALAIANHPKEGGKSEGYPLCMPGLTKDDMTRMGERYIAELRKHSATAKHITDKMPANFLALGLIHLMLPNAKIIHIKRNAADVCLSCFTKLFGSSQLHTYDLTEMGRYYVNYAKLMEHWRKVLPEGAFFEVQYEELVADKEAQTRRLIEYCGLEWDDACLESHKTERGVKTASIIQVRQPVYTTSVERWRHYEKHLQPLFEALGEYAPTR